MSDVVTVKASPLVAASSRLLVSAAWVPAVPWTTAPTLKAVAVNVPAVTAVAMAVFKSPTVLVPAAFAVKLNWSPLVPSLMVVTEFACQRGGESERSGCASSRCLESRTGIAGKHILSVEVGGLADLVDFLQDRLEFRIECGRLTPGDAAGGAFGRERNSAVKKRGDLRQAPSAVCSKPTPLVAFCCDWFRAAMFAVIPSAIDNPAGLSEPELICRPVESCVRVFCRLACVLDNAFSAVRAEMLFRIVVPWCFSLFARLRLHSASFVGPTLRLLVVEKEVVLDNHSIGLSGK